jgi:hypothetical protein
MSILVPSLSTLVAWIVSRKYEEQKVREFHLGKGVPFGDPQELNKICRAATLAQRIYSIRPCAEVTEEQQMESRGLPYPMGSADLGDDLASENTSSKSRAGHQRTKDSKSIHFREVAQALGCSLERAELQHESKFLRPAFMRLLDTENKCL